MRTQNTIGLTNIIKFALYGKMKPLFYASTITVAPPNNLSGVDQLLEEFQEDDVELLDDLVKLKGNLELPSRIAAASAVVNAIALHSAS